MKTKDKINDYFNNLLLNASYDLDELRQLRSSGRDELDIIEELIAFEKLCILQSVAKDVFSLLKISD